ncbi:hypothetical protein AB0O68_36475 [Streptomyces sp. NPDC087512]|uniref:hypothetical protein n=1 Tax=Streptomyces sp. NPDC087512 TaxID=3155059 RepID=UPI00342C67DB
MERLRLLCALRAMGMRLAVATEAASGDVPLGQAIDGRIRELETEVQRMRWRGAALLAVRDSGDDVLALHLLAAVPEPPSGGCCRPACPPWWREAWPRRPPLSCRGIRRHVRYSCTHGCTRC